MVHLVRLEGDPAGPLRPRSQWQSLWFGRQVHAIFVLINHLALQQLDMLIVELSRISLPQQQQPGLANIKQYVATISVYAPANNRINILRYVRRT